MSNSIASFTSLFGNQSPAAIRGRDAAPAGGARRLGRIRGDQAIANPAELRSGSAQATVSKFKQQKAPEPEPLRFSGAEVNYRSRESAALEVTTADGDTVRISFAAATRVRAGSYSAQAGDAQATRQTLSAEQSVNVRVDVDGALDDKEVKEIGDLLERLVSESRADSPPSPPADDFGSLASFHYAYRSNQLLGAETLDA